MTITPIPEPAQRGAYVRSTLPPIAWAMLRLRNEHSRAFRGRYSPENAAWGVEIVEAQYWPHVRTVDVIGPNQIGKTFHVCELPTLYDLCEARETVFYMNGSEDNAKNLWRVRWLPSMRGDAVLAQELHERMDGGEWFERHFRGGGLLYSTGPQSAAALAQRESRIVRCSELEKTPDAIRNEGSAYSLARDRAGAYPSTHMITSDCTITVHSGLSWKRYLQGDRSRFYIPCSHCGHYAAPAHPRHLDEPALGLIESETHLLHIPELAATADLARDQAQLLCRNCGSTIDDRSFRAAVRCGVWVPAGCKVVREDNPKLTPLPRVTWLEDLNRWAANALADWEIENGKKNPDDPPRWGASARLPVGVKLEWTPIGDDKCNHSLPLPLTTATMSISNLMVESGSEFQTNHVTGSGTRMICPSSPKESNLLPAFQRDPRLARNRSFWQWRILAPKYTIGQVAAEIVAGENGTATGDLLDDRKNCSQKTLVIPWVEPTIGSSDFLNEDAVLTCVSEHPQGTCPRDTIACARGIDIGDDEVHWALRAWNPNGETVLVDHGVKDTRLKETRRERGIKYDPNNPAYIATRWLCVRAALDELALDFPHVFDDQNTPHPIRMTYVDSSYMSEEICEWCAAMGPRYRPVKGRGGGQRLGGRSRQLGSQWTDACEKKALACQDVSGRRLRHQYFDPADPRRVMYIDADFWKREVHHGIETTARAALGVSIPGQPTARAWWFLHAGLAPKEMVPGKSLMKRDRYITQVVAERYERFQNPRTGRLESVWRVYQEANHLLDAEAYAHAAAGALGVLPRYGGAPQTAETMAAAVTVIKPAPASDTPVRTPVRTPQVSTVRRKYG